MPPLTAIGLVAVTDLGSLHRSTTANLRSVRGRKVEQGSGAPAIGVLEGPNAVPECTTVGGEPGRVVW